MNSQQEGEGQGVVHDMKLSQDVRHVPPYRPKELLGGLPKHRSRERGRLSQFFFFFFLDGRREGDEMREVAWLTFRSPKSCAGVCLPSRIAPRSAAGESNAIVVQVCWLFSAFRSQENFRALAKFPIHPKKSESNFSLTEAIWSLGGENSRI